MHVVADTVLGNHENCVVERVMHEPMTMESNDLPSRYPEAKLVAKALWELLTSQALGSIALDTDDASTIHSIMTRCVLEPMEYRELIGTLSVIPLELLKKSSQTMTALSLKLTDQPLIIGPPISGEDCATTLRAAILKSTIALFDLRFGTLFKIDG